MSDTPQDDWTLKQVRDWLRERADSGEHCPCCQRPVKIYKRHITHPMVKVLRAMRDDVPHGEWVYLPDYATKGQDEAIMRFWGLIVGRVGVLRDDGSNRNGYWRITDAGRLFLQGRQRIRKTARIYNNRLLGFTGPWIDVKDIAGEYFNYDELMGGN